MRAVMRFGLTALCVTALWVGAAQAASEPVRWDLTSLTALSDAVVFAELVAAQPSSGSVWKVRETHRGDLRVGDRIEVAPGPYPLRPRTNLPTNAYLFLARHPGGWAPNPGGIYFVESAIWFPDLRYFPKPPEWQLRAATSPPSPSTDGKCGARTPLSPAELRSRLAAALDTANRFTAARRITDASARALALLAFVFDSRDDWRFPADGEHNLVHSELSSRAARLIIETDSGDAILDAMVRGADVASENLGPTLVAWMRQAAMDPKRKAEQRAEALWAAFSAAKDGDREWPMVLALLDDPDPAMKLAVLRQFASSNDLKATRDRLWFPLQTRIKSERNAEVQAGMAAVLDLLDEPTRYVIPATRTTPTARVISATPRRIVVEVAHPGIARPTGYSLALRQQHHLYDVVAGAKTRVRNRIAFDLPLRDLDQTKVWSATVTIDLPGCPERKVFTPPVRFDWR